MRDIDQLITIVRARLPGVKVSQLQVVHPGADDDGLWFFWTTDRHHDIQVESTTGGAPFLVEYGHTRLPSASIDDAVAAIVTFLQTPPPTSSREQAVSSSPAAKKSKGSELMPTAPLTVHDVPVFNQKALRLSLILGVLTLVGVLAVAALGHFLDQGSTGPQVLPVSAIPIIGPGGILTEQHHVIHESRSSRSVYFHFSGPAPAWPSSSSVTTGKPDPKAKGLTEKVQHDISLLPEDIPPLAGESYQWDYRAWVLNGPQVLILYHSETHEGWIYVSTLKP